MNLFHQFKNLFAQRPTSQRKTRSVKLHVEGLENRLVPTLTGVSAVIPTTLGGPPVSAVSSNGQSVVVWEERLAAGLSDIRAQLFNAQGQKTGPATLVAWTHNQGQQPAVGIDGQGRFVVAWSEGYQFMVQRFDVTGARLGTTSSFDVSYRFPTSLVPHLAVNTTGDFVFAFRNKIERFFADGTYRGETTIYAADTIFSVAINNTGDFAAAWEQNNDGYTGDVMVSRFLSYGPSLGSYNVNSSGHGFQPSLGMNNAGDIEVAWVDDAVSGVAAILARKISSNGLLGNVVTVALTTDRVWNLNVAMNPTSGTWLAAYSTYYWNPQSQQLTNFHGHLTELNAAGTTVAVYDLGAHTLATSVSINGTGQYLVTTTPTPDFSYGVGKAPATYFTVQFGQHSADGLNLSHLNTSGLTITSSVPSLL